MKPSKTTLWILWVLQWIAVLAGVKLFLAGTISSFWLIVTLFFGLFVLGLFIYDVTKNENLNKDKKTLWILFMLFMFTIASFIYLLTDRKK